MKMVLMLSLVGVLIAGCSASLPDITGPRNGQWRETLGVDLDIIAAAVEKFHGRTGEFPARLELLVVGPDDWPDLWEPLLPTSVTLKDPWGYPYRLQVFDRSRALLTGIDFQVICAGPDHVFATGDDVARPEPNALYSPGISPPGPAHRPTE